MEPFIACSNSEDDFQTFEGDVESNASIFGQKMKSASSCAVMNSEVWNYYGGIWYFVNQIIIHIEKKFLSSVLDLKMIWNDHHLFLRVKIIVSQTQVAMQNQNSDVPW